MAILLTAYKQTDNVKIIVYLVLKIFNDLWWEFESIVADTSGIVNIWMVDGGQESYFGRLKWVPKRGKQHVNNATGFRTENSFINV